MLMCVADIGMVVAGMGRGWLLPGFFVACLAIVVVFAAFAVAFAAQSCRPAVWRTGGPDCYGVGPCRRLRAQDFPGKENSEKELTPTESIKIMHWLKKMLYGCVLLLLALPAVAQDRTDTTYVFRFMPTDDMFYVPYAGNGDELARLEKCVKTYWTDITEGRIRLRVDGYCHSRGSRKGNLETAKLRSNRVKSELILRQGLKEECFITKNHAAAGDYVTVTLRVPVRPVARPDTPAPTPPAGEAEEPDEVKGHTGPETEPAETPAPSAGSDRLEEVPAGDLTTADGAGPAAFSLRANLLRWATLTPDLGIEWRINRHVGIALSGSWTSWSWDNKNRRYALWEVMPELRYYIGKEKRGYLGAMFKAGAFNYKLSATGRQGDLMGGGLTGGYQLRLNKALSMDFSLAVGGLHADYDRYEVVDGVRVRRGTETKNWWGPIHAGVTLVWNIF